MKRQEILRRVFQVLAVILFILQFQQSVRKYFEYPVVVQTSRVPIQDIPAPVVYVCQTDQFNFAKARSYGYSTNTNFITGINDNSSTITWNGMNMILTYNDLENLLYEYNYTALKVRSYSGKDNSSDTNQSSEKHFLFPHGFCMKLSIARPMNWIKIWSTNKVKISFVDPAEENDIHTEETINAQVTIGPVTDSFFEKMGYVIEYERNDHSINEGITCTDYETLGTSYGTCLNNILKEEMRAEYGCNPPWVPGHNSTQECKQNIDKDKEKIEKKPIFRYINELLWNREPDLFKKCLPPCISMTIKFHQVVYSTNRLNAAYFNAKSSDYVRVLKEVYSYDIFSLTVDLGSALGLWMGLSLLSILDYILDNWISIKKLWNR